MEIVHKIGEPFFPMGRKGLILLSNMDLCHCRERRPYVLDSKEALDVLNTCRC